MIPMPEHIPVISLPRFATFNGFGSPLLRTLALLAALLPSQLLLAAPYQVELSDPTWQFTLDNTVQGQSEAKLHTSELSFSRQLQPLLQQQRYQEVAALFAGRSLTEDSAALNVLRGQVLLTLQQFDAAAEALQQALQSQPNLARAHQALSMVRMQQQRFNDAAPHLSRAIALGAADAQTYGQLGFVLLKKSQPASAIAAYQQAMMLDAANPQWQQGLLYALTESQAWAQASALIEQQLQREPANNALWLQRAQLAVSQQNMPQALSSIEVALRLGEKRPANLVLASQLHFNSGSAERAVTLLQRAMRSGDSTEAWQSAVLQAIGYLASQQQWQTLSPLLTASQPHLAKFSLQQQASIALASGQLAQHEKRMADASRLLRQATELDPANGHSLLALASHYQALGNTGQARIIYQRASSIAAVSTAALQHMAQLDIEQQQYSSALNLLRQLQQKLPARQDILDNIRSLEQLVRQQQR